VISHISMARQTHWRLIAILAFLIGFHRPLAAQQDGLLARWNFDEPSGVTATDSVSGFDGTVVNATRVPGRIGTGALQFNGTNSYVLVGGAGSALQLLAMPYTICWWQKWDGPTSAHQGVICMDDGADYSGGYQVYVFLGTSRMNVLHNTGATDVWEVTQLPIGGWHFYTVTFDGATRRFYIDGILSGTRPTNPLLSDNDDPLVFGALRLQSGDFVNFFKGSLDDIRIYQRALAPDEIAALGPPPDIGINRQPIGMRIYSGSSVTLSVDAVAVASTNALSYQWEMNGVPIQNATNSSLVISSSPLTTNKYRVLINLSDLHKYSDEVEVATIAQSDARLLLHLDFETKKDGVFTNETGVAEIFGNVTTIPGRVGKFGVEFTGDGALSIPAGGTDLELVGSSYTIAWWMKARSPAAGSTAQIYTLGDPLTIGNLAGYSARLDGASSSRTIRAEHRNGPQAALLGAFRVSTNWQHVAIVFDGIRRSIYTNGVSAGNPVPASLALFGTGQDDLIIGGQATNRFSAFGSMDDFRIYNYALTTQEIAALVATPLPDAELKISMTASEIFLAWPILDSSQFRLESATDIGDANSWNPISATIQVSGQYYQVRLTKPASTRFYRVRKL
jgi:hypothetical protein